MESLIGRCWSTEPSERPSFDDIFNEFKECEWAILPGVDSAAVGAYVSEVLDAEQRLVERV
jgi:hypothetical protein